jgi:hypothetical protein
MAGEKGKGPGKVERSWAAVTAGQAAVVVECYGRGEKMGSGVLEEPKQGEGRNG